MPQYVEQFFGGRETLKFYKLGDKSGLMGQYKMKGAKAETIVYAYDAEEARKIIIRGVSGRLHSEGNFDWRRMKIPNESKADMKFANEKFEAIKNNPTPVNYGIAMGDDRWGEQMKVLIPDHMWHVVCNWVAFGDVDDDFMEAVISSDLFKALGRADARNYDNIQNWCMFFYNYAPAGCYGAVEHVRHWREIGGFNGINLRDEVKTEE